MSYTPTVWETGDIITAAKLNKEEEGIEAAYPYIVQTASYDPENNDAILDSSFSDIYEAISSGRAVILYDEQSEKNVTLAYLAGTSYIPGDLYPYDVSFFTMGGVTITFYAENETDSLKQYSAPI